MMRALCLKVLLTSLAFPQHRDGAQWIYRERRTVC